MRVNFSRDVLVLNVVPSSATAACLCTNYNDGKEETLSA